MAAKKTAMKRSPAGKRRAAKTKTKKSPKVRVRMYRQGLGDCFLVTFFTGPAPLHMLIDCGSLGATTTGVKIARVIEDIRKTTGGHIHVLVATHEHKDHVSGFGGDPSPFDTFEVDRVLVAWTEDPGDDLAKEVKKYKRDLRIAVAFVSNALAAAKIHDVAERKFTADTGNGIRHILGFFDDLPAAGQMLGADFSKGVDESMRYVVNRAGKDKADYLKPGATVEDAVPGVRLYVLGPPQDESALRNMGKHGSPELYSLAAQMASAMKTCSKFGLAGMSFEEYRNSADATERQELESKMPFDPRFRLDETSVDACQERFAAYYNDEESWRRIDADWLSGGGDMALQLDTYTNNTSLALAIEFTDDKRVLLFPADAQVGNWLSWHEHTWNVTDKGKKREVNATDLLGRTVFYKVGHHSSHNATVKAEGLELMEREDLVAMIPVDGKVARGKGWKMPAKALYERLVEKTMGRVVRSDTGWPDDNDRPSTMTKAEWTSARAESGVTISELYIDYELS